MKLFPLIFLPISHCISWLLFGGTTTIYGFIPDNENGRIIKVWIDDALQVQQLRSLEMKYLLEFWHPPEVGIECLVLIPEHSYTKFILQLNQLKIIWFSVNDDIWQTLFLEDLENENEKEKEKNNSTNNNDNPYKTPRHHYADLNEIYLWMKYLEKNYYEKNFVTIKTIGKTINNLPIHILQIGYANNPILFLEGGIHAREWISPASIIYLLDKLLTNHQQQKKLNTSDFLHCFQIQTILIANPDGYDYTMKHRRTIGRFWRKNRNTIGGVAEKSSSSCLGVDLNRNFDANFGKSGIDRHCQQPRYPGKVAFSEIETRLLSEYILTIKSQLKIYISVHAYGQYFILPYAFKTKKKPKNYILLENLLENITKKIFEKYGRKFQSGSLFHWQEAWASGSSTDWVLLHAKVPFGFSVELLPRGNLQQYGFDPSPKLIPESGEQLLLAVEMTVNKLFQCHLTV